MARFLIVDDDEASRITLAALLEDAGHETVEADSLATGRARLAEGGAIDVVLLDQNLPDGSGLGLLSEVEACAPGARVLLVSGDPPPPTLPAVVVGHLAKGEDPARSIARILGLVNGR